MLYSQCPSHKANLPALSLFGSKLKVSQEAVYLRVTFDSRLTWESYFRKMEDKAQSCLNLLRVLSSHIKSRNCNFMLSLYKALMCPIFEYACIAYISAKDVQHSKLQKLQNAAIRSSLGLSAYILDEFMHDASGLPRILDHLKTFASTRFNSMLSTSPIVHQSVDGYKVAKKILHHPSPLDVITSI
jgi:hypothetical protein